MGKRVLLIIFLLLLAGCTGSGPQPDKTVEQPRNMLPSPEDYDPNGVLVMALSGEPTYFNPILYTDAESGSVADLIFNGLIKVNEKLEVVPDLAERWETSADGKVWTFYLRQGVRFHDGAELTAEDVVFTFEKILDPATNTVRRSSYIIDGKPVRFEQTGRFTVRAVLPEPFAPFLLTMGMGILPKHLLDHDDINTSSFNHQPVGTGPFKFVRYKTADHVLLERNDDYFVKKPRLAKIFFKIITETNVQLVALRRGEIDVAGIPPKDLEKIRREPNINLFMYDGLQYVYLGYNCRKPPFDDMQVRRAFAHAIDKNMLIRSVAKDQATPAYSHAHPLSWSYTDDVDKFPYDPEKARRLLQEAGWKTVNGTLHKNGQPFEFVLYIAKGSTSAQKTAAIIQQDLKKIGVSMDIRILEWSSLLKIVNAQQDPKDFDAMMMAWSLALDPDSYSIWHSSQYPQGFNHNGYSNKRVDELLELGRRTLDQKERATIYKEFYRIIAAEQPYLFLWYPRSIAGVSKRVGGLSEPGPAGLFVNMEDVFVVK